MAFDQTIGKVEFHSPAVWITRLTKYAKSDLQRKQQDDALDKLATQISKIISFPAVLGCEFSKDHLNVQESSGEVDGSWNVECKKNPTGSKVNFHFQKHFPHIQKVDGLLLMGSLQKNFDATKKGATLELK